MCLAQLLMHYMILHRTPLCCLAQLKQPQYLFFYFLSITGLHRRKAVVRDWFGNGEAVTLKGKLELIQQSEYDVTNVEVTLEGLNDIRNYKIHVVSSFPP